MLRVFSNASQGSPKSGVEEKTIWLIVWAENDKADAEIHFMYGPSSDVFFREGKLKQKLTIILESPQNIPSADPRFSITHFTSDRMKPIEGIKHKRKSDPQQTSQPDKHHSELTATASEAEFNLTMSPGDSFYLNIIINDTVNPGRLISCDPQVENGTSTSP